MDIDDALGKALEERLREQVHVTGEDNEADAPAGEVELAWLVDAGQLRGLASDQHATRCAADLGGAGDELGDLLLVDPVCRDIVEQEERVGAAAENVVDAVRREI